MYDYISVKQEKGIKTVFLSNPPTNFITSEMLKELYRELVGSRDDRSLKVLILTGGVKNSFCTHYDVRETLEYIQLLKKTPKVFRRLRAALIYFLFKLINHYPVLDKWLISFISKQPLYEQGIYYWMRCIDILDTMPKPVIAAINGVCLGGGLELALRCDFRLMAKGEKHYIGFPEILVGIVPGGTGTFYRAAQLLGEGKALELMMTGRLCTPDEAYQAGLIHNLAEPDQLMLQAVKLAEVLSIRAPIALRSIKRSIKQGCCSASSHARIIDLEETEKILTSKDARRGLKWYVEDLLNEELKLFNLDKLLDKYNELSVNKVSPVNYKGD